MPDFGVTEALAIGTAVVGGISAVNSLTKKQPKPGPTDMLSPTANADLPAAPGVQHQQNIAQIPSFNVGNFGQYPQPSMGASFNNGDLLKTLGNFGGGY